MQERNRVGNSFTSDMWLNPDVQYNTGKKSENCNIQILHFF